MNALCIIPPAVRVKATPVSASVKIPAGTSQLLWYPITTRAMLQNDAFVSIVEARFRLTGNTAFTEEDARTNTIEGDVSLIPGGIVGGQPGQLPAEFVNFEFQSDGPGGGGSIPAGADFVRITLIPVSGNNGGDIYCGCVLVAESEMGDTLVFDTTTRGS